MLITLAIPSMTTLCEGVWANVSVLNYIHMVCNAEIVKNEVSIVCFIVAIATITRNIAKTMAIKLKSPDVT